MSLSARLAGQQDTADKYPEDVTTPRSKTREREKLPSSLDNLDFPGNDEFILRELCTVNGVNHEKLCQGSGTKVKKLEIFFFGCPHIPVGMNQFTNLNSLCIVNQRFNCISNLEACPLLEELWICETQVKKIEGLSHCQCLTRLHLYSNLISKIEGLEMLVKLEKLWLNGNAISSIEGLERLCKLKDLNLSGNSITTIGNSLDHLAQLRTLDLSGNKIYSLNEIVYLARLTKLNSLSLCHPMDSPNPVCCLCNYSTHMLYHLPQLNFLDGREVASQELQKLIQGLVLRKVQYYRMKIHHCRILGDHKKKQLQNQLNAHIEDCHVKMRTLSKHLKLLSLSQTPSSDKESLSKLVSILSCHIDKSQKVCSDACLAIEAETEQKCQYWLVELRSGGNVKLTSCNPSQSSFRSCCELIHSRFSVDDVQNFGISGLEVTEVVRVENRLLFNCFNNKLKSLLDKEPYFSMTPGQFYKKMVDYLFLVWQPDNESLCQICQDGFIMQTPFLWLTNSVNISDHIRLAQDKGLAKTKCGQLLLCKVFIGQTAEAAASVLPTRAAFPNADSVFKGHGPATQGNSTELYCKDWYIFDTGFVLPEYIIHFTYLSPHFPKSEMKFQCHSLPSHDHIASLTPPTSVCPRLAMLDESTLLELTGQPSLTCIQEVNLCNNRLTRFRLSASLPQMTSLILSANELTMADDFSNLPNLELLDISFNKLTSLQGLKGVPKLKSLDVSWNYLTNYQDDLGPLCKHSPLLQDIDTRYNPWKNQEQLKSYVLGRIKTLRIFNCSPVTEEEASMALKKIISEHLSLATLLNHAHTSVSPRPSLSVEPLAHTMQDMIQPPKIPNSAGVNSEGFNKITTLCLCNLGLRKLAHLDEMPHLQWLSLANNALTSLESIVHCTNLEELTLDNNYISTIEEVLCFNSLRWLSLSGNQLSRLPSGMWGLSKLQYFNVSYNVLSCLQELRHLTFLMELYLSANLVSNSRELFSLKNLSSLVVLDLTFNPLTSLDTYRAFVVFHLSFLRALDGKPIEVSEVVGAKEKLGGRLTQDFIFQKYPNLQCNEVVKLDLPNCGLKHVDLTPVQSFNNLASLNLENNFLTSFSGLIHLNHLKVLCLNHNQIEMLLPTSDPASSSTHILHSLQVLHLAYNGISDLSRLQLSKILTLRALFLQGNEISKVECLEDLESLTELVLDRNRIKSFHENSFTGLLNLKELHLEENRLKDLSHFKPPPSLERLYLGLNRIQDYSELEKLGSLQNLMELSVINNPISRRLQHRVLLIYQHPSLVSLDGVIVTAAERQAAEMVFSEEEHDHLDMALPGLSGATPLKVMNVPFGNRYTYRCQASDTRSIYGHSEDKKRGRK